MRRSPGCVGCVKSEKETEAVVAAELVTAVTLSCLRRYSYEKLDLLG